jgi:hypothetical protein
MTTQFYTKCTDHVTHSGVHHFKIVNTSQGYTHKYENLKRKLYNCNPNIYFNRTCLKKQLTPTMKRINTTNTSSKLRVVYDYIHLYQIY